MTAHARAQRSRCVETRLRQARRSDFRLPVGLIGSSADFVAAVTEIRLVPPDSPWPLAKAAVWVSGVFELPGAARQIDTVAIFDAVQLARITRLVLALSHRCRISSVLRTSPSWRPPCASALPVGGNSIGRRPIGTVSLMNFALKFARAQVQVCGSSRARNMKLLPVLQTLAQSLAGSLNDTDMESWAAYTHQCTELRRLTGAM